MKGSDPELTATFQNVSALGAGYLAVTWAFLRLVMTEGATDLVYATALFGMLLQLAFVSIFQLQRRERFKMLRISEEKLSMFRDEGDVVLLMLNWLCWLVVGCLLLFGVLGVDAALHPHAAMRRVVLPS